MATVWNGNLTRQQQRKTWLAGPGPGRTCQHAQDLDPGLQVCRRGSRRWRCPTAGVADADNGAQCAASPLPSAAQPAYQATPPFGRGDRSWLRPVELIQKVRAPINGMGRRSLDDDEGERDEVKEAADNEEEERVADAGRRGGRRDGGRRRSSGRGRGCRQRPGHPRCFCGD